MLDPDMDIDTDKLEWAMGRLIPKDRLALELRAEGHTFRQIAVAVGCVSLERGRQRYLAACRKMRKLLKSSYYDCMVHRGSNAEAHGRRSRTVPPLVGDSD